MCTLMFTPCLHLCLHINVNEKGNGSLVHPTSHFLFSFLGGGGGWRVNGPFPCPFFSYFFGCWGEWRTLILVDITFMLTLIFCGHYFLFDITFLLSLLFVWHYFLFDIIFGLILLVNWHYFFVDITFLLILLLGWHYFLVDITFWLTLYFGWYYHQASVNMYSTENINYEYVDFKNVVTAQPSQAKLKPSWAKTLNLV